MYYVITSLTSSPALLPLSPDKQYLGSAVGGDEASVIATTTPSGNGVSGHEILSLDSFRKRSEVMHFFPCYEVATDGKLTPRLVGDVRHFLQTFSGSFMFPPPTAKLFFWKISENIITNRFEYKPESFSFKLILKVIVKDSDTNFVHTFSLSSHAFLMKKSTVSCFKSSINTQYEHNYSQNA